LRQSLLGLSQLSQRRRKADTDISQTPTRLILRLPSNRRAPRFLLLLLRPLRLLPLLLLALLLLMLALLLLLLLLLLLSPSLSSTSTTTAGLHFRPVHFD